MAESHENKTASATTSHAAPTKDSPKDSAKDAASAAPKVSAENQALADAVTAGILKATLGARSAPSMAAADLDRTIPGGKYARQDGTFVNANGHEIDEDGKMLHPEDAQLDKFGRPV